MTQTGKTRNTDAAIAALLECRTIEDAADQCKVCKRTLIRWMKHEKFKKQYAEARREMLAGAINRLRSADYDAGKRLHDIVLDKDAAAPAAVSAAAKVLDLLLKATEIEDLSEGLDRLETSINK